MSIPKHIFKFYTADDRTTKIVMQAEGVEVGQAYQLTDGFYRGKMMLVDWISFDKKILNKADGKRYRQISGMVVSVKTKYNTTSAHLTDKVENKSPLSKLSNQSIILGARAGKKVAIHEFIRRFKRVPKSTNKR